MRKSTTERCTKCGAPVEVTEDEAPLPARCWNCGRDLTTEFYVRLSSRVNIHGRSTA